MIDLAKLDELYTETQWFSKEVARDPSMLKDLHKQLNFIQNWMYKNTEGYIDQGSSRDTYYLGNGLVIKIAWGNMLDEKIEQALKNKHLEAPFFTLIGAGIAQNKAEVNSMKCGVKSVITNVTDASPKFWWIIQEYAEPINSNEEFEQLTGINFMKMIALIRMETRERNVEIRKDEHFSKNPWFMKLYKTMQGCNISWMDLVALEHFGKIGNRVVLLDHGGTRNVINRLYEYVRLIVADVLEEQNIPTGPAQQLGMQGFSKKVPGGVKPASGPVGTTPTQGTQKTVVEPGKAKQAAPAKPASPETDEIMAAIQSKLPTLQDPTKLRQILALLNN